MSNIVASRVLLLRCKQSCKNYDTVALSLIITLNQSCNKLDSVTLFQLLMVLHKIFIITVDILSTT